MRRTTLSSASIGGLLLLLLLLLLAACEKAAPAGPTGQNLLLITLCGVRADVLDECVADGSASLLAALRARADLVTRVQTLSTDCMWAHAGLFTSLEPPAFGNGQYGYAVVRNDVDWLANELRAAKYATAAFLSRSELDPGFGVTLGFESVSMPPIERFATAQLGAEAAATRLRRSPDATVAAAKEWLAHAASPFLVWVQLNGLAVESATDAAPTRADARRQVAAIDAALGPLFTELEVAQRDARTLVVLLSDHGELLGEPAFGHRFAEPAVATVPLWIVDPDPKAPPWPNDLHASVEVAPQVMARLAPKSVLGRRVAFTVTRSPAVAERFVGADRRAWPWYVERGELPLGDEPARAWLPELTALERAHRGELDAVGEFRFAALLALAQRPPEEESDFAALRERIIELADRDHPFAASAVANPQIVPKVSERDVRVRAAKAAILGAPWYFPPARALAALRQTELDHEGALAELERFGREAPLSENARAEYEKLLAQTAANLKGPTPRR